MLWLAKNFGSQNTLIGFNLLEQLRELRIFFFFFTFAWLWRVLKRIQSKEMYRLRYRKKCHRTSLPSPGVPPSRNFHVFSYLEAFQTLLFRVSVEIFPWSWSKHGQLCWNMIGHKGYDVMQDWVGKFSKATLFRFFLVCVLTFLPPGDGVGLLWNEMGLMTCH